MVQNTCASIDVVSKMHTFLPLVRYFFLCANFYIWRDFFFGAPFFSLARLSSLVRLIFSLARFFSPIKNYDKHHFVERLIHLIEEHSLLIITGIQASGVIIDRLLRQCCFVWSEIVGPYSSGNFND